MRHGNGIDPGLAGLRIIDHRIAARVISPVFIFRRIALLGAEIDFSAGARVVASMNFRLGSESFGIGPDLLLGIDDRSHALCLGIEFDEPGIESVGMRADIEPAVVSFDNGKIPFPFRGRLLGNGVGRCWDPLVGRRLGRFLIGCNAGRELGKNESRYEKQQGTHCAPIAFDSGYHSIATAWANRHSLKDARAYYWRSRPWLKSYRRQWSASASRQEWFGLISQRMDPRVSPFWLTGSASLGICSYKRWAGWRAKTKSTSWTRDVGR